jgi:hypothetical protein
MKICKNKEIKDKQKEYEKYIKEKEKEYEKDIKEKEKQYEKDIKEKEKEIENLKKNRDILLKDKDREYKFLSKENENLKQQLYKKEDEILDLKDRIERMGTIAIKKSTTTTNNTINHLELNQFISQDYIDNKIENKFNDTYIIDGMRGVAQFVRDHIIKLDNGTLVYGCYDYARKMFKYRDDEGNEDKDPGALKLIRMLQPGLLKQTQVLHEYFDNECNILEKEEERNGILSNKEQKDLEKMKFLKDSANKTGMVIQIMDKTAEFTNQLSNVST